LPIRSERRQLLILFKNIKIIKIRKRVGDIKMSKRFFVCKNNFLVLWTRSHQQHKEGTKTFSLWRAQKNYAQWKFRSRNILSIHCCWWWWDCMMKKMNKKLVGEIKRMLEMSSSSFMNSWNKLKAHSIF
jgi:hypothetical protein